MIPQSLRHWASFDHIALWQMVGVICSKLSHTCTLYFKKQKTKYLVAWKAMQPEVAQEM